MSRLYTSLQCQELFLIFAAHPRAMLGEDEVLVHNASAFPLLSPNTWVQRPEVLAPASTVGPKRLRVLDE